MLNAINVNQCVKIDNILHSLLSFYDIKVQHYRFYFTFFFYKKHGSYFLEVQTIFSKYFVFTVYHITNVKIEEFSEK